MTVFSRVADILQAKTHKLLNQLEDPNETLDLSYEKMIAGLQQTKLHLADVVAQQKSLERQIEAAQQEAAKAEHDARLALQAGREDLAKEGVKRQSPQCRHVARRSQMRLAVRHCVRERAGPGGSRKRATASTGKRNRKFADSPLEGAVRCELVSAAGSDSAPYEFLESIKKEGPQPSDALPPFSCNQN